MSAASERTQKGLVDVLWRDGDLGVVVVALALLALGWVARGRFVGETATWAGHGVTLQHPRGWVAVEKTSADGAHVDATITDLLGGAAWKARATVRIEPLGAVDPAMVPDMVALDLGRTHALYHALDQMPLTVAGKPAVRYDYAYAVDPIAGIDSSDVPIVVRAMEVVAVRDGKLYTVGVAAPLDEFTQAPSRYEAILSSLVLP